MLDTNRLIEFVEMLRQSQHWPPEQMRTYQEELLSRLVDHARNTVPFYHDRLAPLYRRRWGPRLHKWEDVPVLTRADIATADEALLSQAIPADHGEISHRRSSGTTSDPVKIAITETHRTAWLAIAQREIEWAGINANLRYGVIRHAPWLADATPPDGKPLGLGAPAARIFGQTGDCVGLRWDATSREKAAWISHAGIEILNARPGDYRQIVQAMSDDETLAGGLKTALLLGEPIDAGLRHRIIATLGVNPVDRYSANEAGYIALQCPDGLGFRIQSEVIYVEIADENGRAVPPGTLGKVLVTPLYNYANPLIRYDCGDYAIAGETPQNGNRLPVLSTIAGRPVNRFRHPDGSPFWPSMSGLDIERHFPCQAYQLAQISASAYEFRYVSAHRLSGDRLSQLRAHLIDKIGQETDITFRRLATPPVAIASRKLSVFVNEADFPAGSELVDFEGDD